MLSFRLSEDEYERLRNMSEVERARSVSDFARSALCRLPGGNAVSHEAAGKMKQLEEEVRQLRVDMHQLCQLIDAVLGRSFKRTDVVNLQEEAREA